MGCCLSNSSVTLSHMSICAGVVVAVALHEVDTAPNAKTRAKRDYQSLQYVNCAVEKLHKLPRFLPLYGSENVVGNKNAAITFRRLRPRRTTLFRICQRVRPALRLPDGWTYTVQRQKRFSCRSRKGICSSGAVLYRTCR